MPNAIVVGTGSYLPERRLKTRELETWTFINRRGESYQITADEIVKKTGIEERRIAEEGENCSDMAAKAGKAALEAAGVHPDDVDLVLMATSTPDYHIPKCAPLVASKIGMHGVAAYDFGKDCTGWIEAVEAASYFIKAGRYEKILVVAAEKISTLVNTKNKATAVLYGDGAGAALLAATDEPNRGFMHAVAGSQGEAFDRLYVPAGGTVLPFSPDLEEGLDRLKMDGEAIAAYGRQVFAMGVERVLAEQRLVPENLDLLVPHQANLRTLEAGIKALDLPFSKVVMTVDRYGNTAAASVPIALDHAVRESRLKPGYLFCLVAYGAGLSWVAALVRY